MSIEAPKMEFIEYLKKRGETKFLSWNVQKVSHM